MRCELGGTAVSAEVLRDFATAELPYLEIVSGT